MPAQRSGQASAEPTAAGMEAMPRASAIIPSAYLPYTATPTTTVIQQLTTSPLLCLPLEANLNPFLSPSIREYRECSSQASPHPLHNARESPSRRDQLNSRLSDLQRCRGSSFGDQKASSIRLSPVFRFDRLG